MMNDITVAAAPVGSADPRVAAAGQRRCALDRLARARQDGRPLSPLVLAAAAALGVAPRTLWRWLAEGAPAETTVPGWRPSDDDIDAYVRWKGSAAAAWLERRDKDPSLPTLRTFQRALLRVLTPGDRATIRDGVEGRRRHQMYLRWAPEARNDLWECDHKLLDVPVIFPRCQRPRQPWVTTFLDGFSRAVMGWAIADRPSSATVQAALGEAIRVDPEHGPFGGVPGTLRPDQGLEFAADVIRNACGVLTVGLDPAWPYQPNLKGKQERWYRTVIDGLLAEMPHFTGGPRDAAKRLWGKDLPMLTLAEFVTAFGQWVRSYNCERPHQALEGQTPLQRWLEDATPLCLVPDDELRWTLLGEKERGVNTSGIRFHRLNFVAPELNGLAGDKVGVRFRPHDDTSIEVFHAGTHLCTAYPQGTLGPEERAALLAHRRADAAEQARRQRRATRLARERLSPATAHRPAEDVTVIPATPPRFVRPTQREVHDLREVARGDLLHLPGIGAR
jgi:putative transposase